jgi:hypothetical protein
MAIVVAMPKGQQRISKPNSWLENMRTLERATAGCLRRPGVQCISVTVQVLETVLVVDLVWSGRYAACMQGLLWPCVRYGMLPQDWHPSGCPTCNMRAVAVAAYQ